MRSLLKYPVVRSEEETLKLVLAGHSIARYGDGEFRLVSGSDCVSQVASKELTRELCAILKGNVDRCLVGIPTMDARSPKIGHWSRYKGIYPRYMGKHVRYYSAFISRPDSAPWINTPEYFDDIESLWAGQEVTLVANGARSLKPEFLGLTARSVNFVQCSYRDSYSQVDALERACLDAGRRVLLCCGATATVLAWRLAKQGLHAVDLGHVGQHWRPYANPKSKVPAAA
jgi:hypothetical protein